MNSGIFKYIKKKKTKESNTSQEVLLTNKIDFFAIENEKRLDVSTNKNNGIRDAIKIKPLEIKVCDSGKLDSMKIKSCEFIKMDTNFKDITDSQNSNNQKIVFSNFCSDDSQFNKNCDNSTIKDPTTDYDNTNFKDIAKYDNKFLSNDILKNKYKIELNKNDNSTVKSKLNKSGNKTETKNSIRDKGITKKLKKTLSKSKSLSKKEDCKKINSTDLSITEMTPTYTKSRSNNFLTNSKNPTFTKSTSLKNSNTINLTNSDYNTINKHVLLPKKYLNLSRIFRVMLTIQKYNFNRNLSNIFSVLKISMEQILNTKIYLKDIEQIKFLIKDKMIIKLIRYNDEQTFTYQLLMDNDEFDLVLWKYYQKHKDQSKRVDENVCDVPRDFIFSEICGDCHKKDGVMNEFNDNIMNKINEGCINESTNIDYPKKENFKESIKVEIIGEETGEKYLKEKKFNFEYNQEINKNFKDNSGKENQSTVNSTNEKKLSILERIKEREKQRKQQFILTHQKADNTQFLQKLSKYYKKENKQSIKISEIIKVFDLYDGYNFIKKLTQEEDSYHIKNMFGQEYLTRKKMNV